MQKSSDFANYSNKQRWFFSKILHRPSGRTPLIADPTILAFFHCVFQICRNNRYKFNTLCGYINQDLLDVSRYFCKMFDQRVCLLVTSVLAVVGAQIPSLGYCPDYVPMTDFNMNRFLGKWYETERYFTFSEVASRCIVTDYAKGPSGRIYVSNEVTNRLTGVKRVISGNLQLAGKQDEGKLNVKYTTSPISQETTLSVLDTDYDNFAVVWSCTGIGPIHAQNAWLMTRDRLPTGEVLQKAYGILDKFKISRTFFIKTDQEGCAVAASEINAANGITAISTIPEATGTEQRIESAKEVDTTEEKATTVAEHILSTSTKETSGKDGPSEPPVRLMTCLMHMQKMLLLLLLAMFATGALAQVPFLGSCPNIPTMDNFDTNKYAGKWFEAERYFALFEFGGKCITGDYHIKKNGDITIINHQTSALTGIRSTIEGLGNMIDRSDEAKLTVQFPSLPVSFSVPYWVLDTDYENYSVVWSCTNFGIFSVKNAWILTRSRKPSLESMKKAYHILDSNGISRAYFIRTDQVNCPSQY
ncbi:PREDICTED: uncharacterized protein LOC108558043 [Nicrophorus vespilloides]|uniref:Apolipoprotein D n=1 Tax=Nicrophorus vespilloides TaxID=110193 RepID=A0ABM1M6X2_NICVS|nr:PREDICTED: uncharacterized protein LOC108558043 [Nicrophorus vespilloides]